MFVDAMEDVVIAIMIEKAPAYVENLEALLSVGGIDMVQFGTWRLLHEHRPPGRVRTCERVREAEKFVVETSLKMGVAPRAEISSPDQAKRYLDMGVKHFCIGTDVSILMDWFRTQGEEMRRVLEGA